MYRVDHISIYIENENNDFHTVTHTKRKFLHTSFLMTETIHEDSVENLIDRFDLRDYKAFVESILLHMKRVIDLLDTLNKFPSRYENIKVSFDNVLDI